MPSDTKPDQEPNVLAPTVLLFCTDLMFGVQLQNMARKAGLRPVMLKPGAPLPDGELLVVDLNSRADWEQPIKLAVEQGMNVVAFGPHMDSEARGRARAAGASRVLANSNLQRDLPAILLSVSGAESSKIGNPASHIE